MTKTIVGYLNHISVAPGDNLQAMVSTTASGFDASLVRLISGDDRPHGTGYRDESIDASFSGRYPGRSQPLTRGSFAELPEIPALDEFRFCCLLYPTLAKNEPQTIVRAPGFELSLVNEVLTLETDSGRTAMRRRVRLHRWHEIDLRAEANTLHLTLSAAGVGPAEADAHDAIDSDLAVQTAQGSWVLAAGTFNGRIEAPRIESGDKLIGAWDFAQGMSTSRIHDSSSNARHGHLFQTPTRAVKGSRWDGSTQRWTEAPEQYAAIHFHEDDLTDAGWQVDFEWLVPNGLRSGLYAIRLEEAGAAADGGSEDYLPFVVRPARTAATKAKVAFLASSATYLAYANETMSLSDKPAREPNGEYLLAHPEVGHSLYDYHADGSGVHYSSRLRPVMNLKPKTLTWSFNADTNVTAWLEQTGIDYDVVTDEDLHRDGADLLDDYLAVVTGTHPEYFSTAMLDGLQTWLDGGGRLMYMGGNGFYWRIAVDPENPAIIEVRRAEGGTRAWMEEPGQYYHSFTGEFGGLWRRLGRPPNIIAGVGFAAQGFDGGTHYRVQPGADDPRVSFIMGGVHSGVIGDYGTQAGGAAGEEIDRWDPLLGSPRHAIVLASSQDHRPGMLRVIEEIHMMLVPGEDPDVRADMVFFETAAGGAVFSTGSISYAGALSANDYDNDIQTITRNVLDRFIDPEPFTLPDDF